MKKKILVGMMLCTMGLTSLTGCGNKEVAKNDTNWNAAADAYRKDDTKSSTDSNEVENSNTDVTSDSTSDLTVDNSSSSSENDTPVQQIRNLMKSDEYIDARNENDKRALIKEKLDEMVDNGDIIDCGEYDTKSHSITFDIAGGKRYIVNVTAGTVKSE